MSQPFLVAGFRLLNKNPGYQMKNNPARRHYSIQAHQVEKKGNQ
jgi:hypothetical protein